MSFAQTDEHIHVFIECRKWYTRIDCMTSSAPVMSGTFARSFSQSVFISFGSVRNLSSRASRRSECSVCRACRVARAASICDCLRAAAAETLRSFSVFSVCSESHIERVSDSLQRFTEIMHFKLLAISTACRLSISLNSVKQKTDLFSSSCFSASAFSFCDSNCAFNFWDCNK